MVVMIGEQTFGRQDHVAAQAAEFQRAQRPSSDRQMSLPEGKRRHQHDCAEPDKNDGCGHGPLQRRWPILGQTRIVANGRREERTSADVR